MDGIAAELKELKDTHKAFKKENKDIFAQNTAFNKGVKAKSDQLCDLMVAEKLETYVFDGMEFNIKSSASDKHNMEHLGEIMGDGDKYDDYVNSVRTVKTEVRTRNAKRQKAE